MRNNFAVFIVLSMMFSAAGCKSSPKLASAVVEANPLDNEQQIAEDMSRNLEKKYGAWKDHRIENILQSLVSNAVTSDPALRDGISGVRIRLLNTDVPIAVPGLAKTIYISRGCLASIDYENELAFILTSAIILMREQYPQKKFLQDSSEEIESKVLILPTNPQNLTLSVLESGWFESGGFFDFGFDAYFKADKEAVKSVQFSGYDHRGAGSIFKKWNNEAYAEKIKSTIKYGPTVDERYENIRAEVAKVTPLRNPILKSKRFTELKARLKGK